MPFTKTPMQSTEQTKLVPLMYEYETRTRDGAKDTDALNVIWEPVQNQLTGDNYFNALTRDGSIIAKPSFTSGLVNGMWFWQPVNIGYLIVVFPFRVDVLFADDLTVAGTFVFGPNSGQVGGTEFLYQNGNKSFIIYNGQKLLEISSSLVFTQCVDPDLPQQFLQPIVTDVEYLDGYLFIGQGNGTISNSDLNNPQSWSPSNFTKADAYGDNLVGLKRSGNYLVALGSKSIQYYYDAGNPTGTPLGAMVGSTLSIGCIGAIQKKENALYFIGTSSVGMNRVYKLESFKVQEISTPSIQRWITDTPVLQNNNAQFMYGNIVQLNGHAVYIISAITGVSTPDYLCYGFDLETSLWSRFKFSGPLTLAATGNRSTTSTLTAEVRTVYSISTGNGDLYQFQPNTGTDAGSLFNTTFVTPQQDFGTYRIKFGSRLVLWADRPAGNTSCDVSWTDDDYKTFSTPRSLQMNTLRPALYALGSFNRRAFKVDYTGGLPMRWKFIELDYDQGTA